MYVYTLKYIFTYLTEVDLWLWTQMFWQLIVCQGFIIFLYNITKKLTYWFITFVSCLYILNKL